MLFPLPGCGASPLPYALCTTSQTAVEDCLTQQPTRCPPQMQYCPLVNDCHNREIPCDCVQYPNSDACRNLDQELQLIIPGSSLFLHLDEDSGGTMHFPDFELIHDLNISVPDGGLSNRSRYQVIPDIISVREYDVLGYQYEQDNNPGMCQLMETGINSRRLLLADDSIPDWLSHGDVYHVSNTSASPGYSSCDLQAVYAIPDVTSPPDNLVHHSVLTRGSHRFSVTVANAVSAAEANYTVLLEKSIRTVSVWVFTGQVPAFNILDVSGESLHTVYVESGVSTSFLMMTYGSDAVTKWNINPLETIVFQQDCPTEFQYADPCVSAPPGVRFAKLESTYMIADDGGMRYVPVDLSCYNNISHVNLSLAVYPELRIPESLDLLVTQPSEYPQTTAPEQFNVTLPPGAYAQYNWSVSDGYFSTDEALQYSFPDPGEYVVSVTAYNHISSGQYVWDIIVYRSANLEDTFLTTVPELVAVATPVNITVTFRCAQWSLVDVDFDFVGEVSKSVRHTQMSSTGVAVVPTTHTFRQTGGYTVNITVTDVLTEDTVSSTGQLTVLQPLEGVSIRGLPVTMETGATVDLTAVVQGGSGTIYYLWDFGDGSSVTSVDSSSVRYSYNEPGDFAVSVQVTNNASTVGHVQRTSVQQPVSGLEAVCDAPTLVGDVTTCSFSVIAGSHVVYSVAFTDNTDHVVTTSNNTVAYTFSSVGTYNISFTASNDISGLAAWTLLHVIDASTLRILAVLFPDCVPTSEPAVFTSEVLYMDPESLEYIWEFGDRSTATQGLDLWNVSHTYSDPGFYDGMILLQTPDFKLTSKTFRVCVQDPVSGIAIDLDGVLSLTRGHYVVTKVSLTVAMGTDYNVAWSVRGLGLAEQDNGQDVVELNITQAGRFHVNATVYNLVSIVSVIRTLEVFEVLRSVSVNCFQKTEDDGEATPQASNLDTGISCVVATKENYLYVAMASSPSNTTYSWNFEGSLDYGNQISHAFSDPGIYRIQITAANPVSRVTSYHDILAQDQVEGLQIQSSSQEVPLVSGSARVTLEATVSKGSNISYAFERCPDHCIQSTDDPGMVTQVFNQSGSHSITVEARNLVSVATATIVINIIEPITMVTVLVDGQEDIQYLVTGDNVTIEIVVERGGGVRYLANILDTSGDIMETWTSPQIQYQFDTAGIYWVQATVSNILSTVTVNHSLEILDPIGDLDLSANLLAGRYAAVGTVYNFTVTPTKGERLQFGWMVQMPDSPNVTMSDIGDVLLYSFSEPGVWYIHTVANNPVSSTSQTLPVFVESVITDVEIVIQVSNSPYVPIGREVHFHVSQNNWSPISYLWTFLDTTPNSEFSTQRVSHLFTKTGAYRVTLSASNNVSSYATSIDVICQQPVSGVSIVPKETTVPADQALTFTVSTTGGTDLAYMWNYGYHGNRNVTSETGRTEHVFPVGGQYMVWVTVHNMVSSLRDFAIIYVVERISGLHMIGCCQDALPLGEAVTVNASVTRGSHLSYNWTIVDDTILKFTGPGVVHTFSALGEYDIGVTATNRYGSKSVWGLARVQERITGFTLQMIMPSSGVVFVGQSADFQTHITSGSDIIYDWQLRKGSAIIQTWSNTSSVSVEFSQGGRYQVDVTAANNISAHRAWIDVTVNVIECEPPVARVIGDVSRVEVRSRRLQFEVDVSACEQYQLVHQWKIYPTTCKHIDLSHTPLLLPPDVKIDTPYLYLPPRLLQYGRYCLIFRTWFDGTPAFDTAQIDLQIKPSSLVPLIQGGNTVIRTTLEDLLLDGSLSYDPDQADGQTSHLKFLWTCQSFQEVRQ